MTETDRLLHELERCQKALKAYKELAPASGYYTNPLHAAARRATLDLTRALAQWRKVLVQPGKVK